MTSKIFRRHFIFRRMAAALGMGFLWANSEKSYAEKTGLDKSTVTNDTLKTIQNLRTIHGNFTEKNITDEQIHVILESAIRAANSSNMQTYSIIVVKDKDKMKKACGYQGSCMLLYCADYNRLKASAKALGHPYYPDGITSFLTASINAALAAQTATIAARSMGIDSLTTNGIHRGEMGRIWDLMEMPKEHCFPVIAQIFGYPTKEPDAQKGRLDGAGVIHYEKYHELTKEETGKIIQQYDDPSAHLGLIDNWKDSGHQHYLDWLFKDWLQRDAEPVKQESLLFTFLKKCGFSDPQKK